MRHAIVFEPGGRVLEAVLAWKSRMAEEWPAAIYLAHPPHCTLWAGTLEQPDAADASLTATLAALRAVTSAIEGPFVFEDDGLAGGGRTCVFQIRATPELRQLQQHIADAIAPHVAPDADAPLPAALRTEPFVSSWGRYGFPFVGPHWIPHVTVGAVPRNEGDAFVDAFMNSDFENAIEIDRITLWRVQGDRHTLMRHWALTGA